MMCYFDETIHWCSNLSSLLSIQATGGVEESVDLVDWGCIARGGGG